MASSGQIYTHGKQFAYEFRIKAPAKVNLSLSVVGRRADGYHQLCGLVAFSDICDELHFKEEGHPEVTGSGFNWSLDISGPFATDLDEPYEGARSNLVLQAAQLFQKEMEGCYGGEIILQKNLPIAAGIGGGSSDAAATLRALQDINCPRLDDDKLRKMAVSLGADVAMCLSPEAKIIAGIGDIFQTALSFQPLAVILVNPGISVRTPDVFNELSAPALSSDMPGEYGLQHTLPELLHHGEAYASFTRAGDLSPSKMIDWLRTQSNDLQAPAIRIAPVIKDVLDVIEADKSCRLARMSGSGATCFGLFDSEEAAQQAAQRVKADHPDWWVVATVLM